MQPEITLSINEMSKLQMDADQAWFEVNVACNLAGAAIYAEVGKAGAEDILCSLHFGLPVDGSGVAAIAYAAMDDEEFALEVFERVGVRFVDLLDSESVVMILNHESKRVQVAAVLAGAAHKRGLITQYIGCNPDQEIVDAANFWQARGRLELVYGVDGIDGIPARDKDRFTLTETHLVSESEKAGSVSDRLTTLADRYRWSITAPNLRNAA
jgi:hypothetical protein